MIIELWILFIVISLILFTIGYYMKNDILRILATIFMFFMGVQLNSPGITYVVGKNVTYVGSNATELLTYSTYVSHTFGFYIMIIALMTFVYIMFERLWSNQ